MVNNDSCNDGMQSKIIYAYAYLVIFVPGLLGNSIAVWVLISFIREKRKGIIFMTNLAFADLAHVLSLPLRVYYYLNSDWPFQHSMCLLCYYLKYVNMYASIAFLVFISVQRCLFVIKPFRANSWKQKYDIMLSIAAWIVVGICCIPFTTIRNSGPVHNDTAHTVNERICFADLPTNKVSQVRLIAMIFMVEIIGFAIPLIVISVCTWKTLSHLKNHKELCPERTEKQKAARMVSLCAVVFLVCFVPYHLNNPLHMMIKQNMIMHCNTQRLVNTFHVVSLCLASLNCCINPLIYFFVVQEFRERLDWHGCRELHPCISGKDGETFVKEEELCHSN
ncbi:putative P2Y purinoceptor 10 [Protopterus annectens]|uniref:putative P2Y purinoceptor 10 n=1 Tax=Protopterus annectens TaxID=7888 RepID=UPI001CFA3928|nr:putative P2Y purinoceptor 10 [Protopterus annectens]